MTQRTPGSRASHARGCLLRAALHLLVGALAVGVYALVIGRWLIHQDPPGPADAIVVLGGGRSGRVRRAIELYGQGYAPWVVFSGGTLQDNGPTCSSAEQAYQAAQALGLPTGAALVVDGAYSTYDEAQNLQRLVRERGWHALIVVTDPFHTRRAGRTLRALLPAIEVRVVAAANPSHDPLYWWKNEDGLIAVFSETLKLGLYWLQYHIMPF